MTPPGSRSCFVNRTKANGGANVSSIGELYHDEISADGISAYEMPRAIAACGQAHVGGYFRDKAQAHVQTTCAC